MWGRARGREGRCMRRGENLGGQISEQEGPDVRRPSQHRKEGGRPGLTLGRA